MNDIFRLHRSGQKRTDEQGRSVAQIIMRFGNWAARSRAYGARKKAIEDESPIYIKVDLTKRRLNLLKKARTMLDEYNGFYASVDGECNLCVGKKKAKERVFFNTELELLNIVKSLPV